MEFDENGVTDLVIKARHTVIFLRMTALELRRIAERTPGVTAELHHMTRQLEADADDLAQVAK